jgi:hypothetical protein
LYSDFKIREIGINHFYTVQCVLRINLFNEVIFIIQWFWLISISAGRTFFQVEPFEICFSLATVYDFLVWLYQCTVPRKFYLERIVDGRRRRNVNAFILLGGK